MARTKPDLRVNAVQKPATLPPEVIKAALFINTKALIINLPDPELCRHSPYSQLQSHAHQSRAAPSWPSDRAGPARQQTTQKHWLSSGKNHPLPPQRPRTDACQGITFSACLCLLLSLSNSFEKGDPS